jgi:hypothetical protein
VCRRTSTSSGSSPGNANWPTHRFRLASAAREQRRWYHYCLDLAAHGSPVVFWSHDDPLGPDQVPDVVAPTLGAWGLTLFANHDA